MLPPTGLPVEDAIPGVFAALADPGVAVLTAETGAGKTTVVPLRLLQAPWAGEGRILVLEPRRLATRLAGRRMAQLLGETLGDTVGIRTRDDRVVGPGTRVEVVTEGILTRRLQSDPALVGVAAVVFDEFHERSLQADLGLALTLEARSHLRPDLRVLVMSATLDAERVSTLLGGAPVIHSPGRTHPVDIRWCPPPPPKAGRRSGKFGPTTPRSRRIEADVASVVHRALRETSGDVLVFVPGIAEIRRVAGLLEHGDGQAGNPAGGQAGRRPLPDDVDVWQLHGSFPGPEQDAAVAPSPPGRRKVVLSTDVAESSITVEGVTAVVDSGLTRGPRFDPGTGMTRLVTTSVSRDSADQRSGRAGRLAPGVGYRLWSRIEQGTRPAHRAAEITQVDLAGLALELVVWGVHDPSTLSWCDPPPAAAWSEATRLLTDLGALDDRGHCTELGRRVVGLGVHPRLGTMIVRSAEEGMGWTACVVAALLEDRDILRPRGARGARNDGGSADARPGAGELPADIAVRIECFDDAHRSHPNLDVGSLHRARDRARDLARRAGVEPLDRAGPAPRGPSTHSVDAFLDQVLGGDLWDEGGGGSDVGRVLLWAYPDRVAQAAGSRGRFRLRTGTEAFVDTQDDLATQPLLVVADLDGHRRNSRIRMAAAISEGALAVAFADQVVDITELVWDRERDELVQVNEQRLGGIRLGRVVRPAPPGAATVDALLRHARAQGLATLGWSSEARRLQARVATAGRHQPGVWPDLSDGWLAAHLDEWLAPFCPGARTRADIEGVDLGVALGSMLSREQRLDLERLVPDRIEVASGRRVPIDYEGDRPTIAVPVQELFGTLVHPTVLDGTVPVVVQLLSPAGRPVQVTSDLPGFWSGSWAEVRKDMAGRYPKHDWPEHPTEVPASVRRRINRPGGAR